MAKSIRQEPLQRHATRSMNDAYGKGILRGQVENAKSRAHTRDHDVTAAESIKTCQTVNFDGNRYVGLIQRLNDKYTSDRSTVFAEVDMRSKKHRNITFRDVAALYGERPRDERVWNLSPYDFIYEWEV